MPRATPAPGIARVARFAAALLGGALLVPGLSIAQFSAWTQSLATRAATSTAAIASSPDGGILLAGTTNPGPFGGTDAWAARLDSRGVPLWRQALDSGASEAATAVLAEADGGALVAGYAIRGSSREGWVARLDASGGIVWQRAFPGDAPVLAAATAGGGGYVLAGSTGDTGWIAGIGAGGAVLWRRTVSTTFVPFERIAATAIAETADGGFVVSGTTTDRVGRGATHTWVARIDAAGTLAWAIVASSGSLNATLTARPLPGGGYALAGSAFSIPLVGGGVVAQVIRLDAAGSVVDSRVLYDPAAFSQTNVAGFAVAGDGGLALAATPGLVLLDPSGALRGVRTFRDLVPTAVATAAGPGFALAGSRTTADGIDPVALKLAADGAGANCAGGPTTLEASAGSVVNVAPNASYRIADGGPGDAAGTLRLLPLAWPAVPPCPAAAAAVVQALAPGALPLLALLVAAGALAARRRA